MIDLALTDSHRGYEDRSAGFAEEFLQPTLGGGRTVAVLSRPLGPVRPVGWVICHSFALEQVHLSRLEVIVARGLSAAGFPVLRYHGQGYGDSEGAEGIGLSSHMKDAIDAVGVMHDQEGVRRVGVMGARFGAAVAALVADEMGLDLMALWEPMVSGALFIRDFLRTRVFSEMADRVDSEGMSGMDRIRSELDSQGHADIKGFLLSQPAHDEIARIDLTKDLSRFRGSALIVPVSKTGKVNPSILKLSEHLQALGGTCAVETVRDPLAAQLGQFHFQTIDGGRGKRDTQFDLDHAVATTTVGWSLGQAGIEATAPQDAAQPSRQRPASPDGVTEYPVFVPFRQEHLAAVLTVPKGEPRVLVLLATGIGAPRSHRFQVWARVARRLAEAGIASIRMEYGGLGDSTGELRELPLIEAPWEEAVAVARFGMEATGVGRFAVAGNCLGATVSLRVAAEIPECEASVGILTRLRDPSSTYQVLHRARGGKLASLIRSNRFLNRVLVRRVRGLKGRAIPGVEDQLSEALSRTKLLFIYSPTDDDVYTEEVQRLLDRMLARLPQDRRKRFELQILPDGPLARLESLSVQSAVIETVTAWLISALEGPPRQALRPPGPI